MINLSVVSSDLHFLFTFLLQTSFTFIYLELYLSTIGMLRQDIENYLKLPIKNPYVDYSKSLLNKLTNHLCYAIKYENRIETSLDLFAGGKAEREQ